MIPLNILILDDEPSIRRILGISLESEGHRVVTASRAVDGLDAAARQSFDLALVDLRIGIDNGLDVIPRLLAQTPWTKIVVITAYAAIDTAVEAIRRGAFDYLPKPFVPAQVLAVVKRVAELRQIETEIAELRADVGRHGEVTLESSNAAMQRAFQLARQFAASEATVLIRGESGTGKGVLAKVIHKLSPRAIRPFTTISCPSLSSELLESELFGHVKGAFTGAVRDTPGRVAATEGGTLFLDEVGDLPTALQPKLLRFIQEREYERVGDTVTRHADVRIISATNVDLEASVRAGRFREDLYYRLNVVQVYVPSLRERPEDIVALASRMLAGISAGRSLRFDAGAIESLRSYDWPGNLRELHNAVERAAILATDDVISRHQFPPTLDRPSAAAAAPAPGDLVSLERLEETHIRRVLTGTKSLEKAASILGIDTATLWRRRKKYGI